MVFGKGWPLVNTANEIIGETIKNKNKKVFTNDLKGERDGENILKNNWTSISENRHFLCETTRESREVEK